MRLFFSTLQARRYDDVSTDWNCWFCQTPFTFLTYFPFLCLRLFVLPVCRQPFDFFVWVCVDSGWLWTNSDAHSAQNKKKYIVANFPSSQSTPKRFPSIFSLSPRVIKVNSFGTWRAFEETIERNWKKRKKESLTKTYPPNVLFYLLRVLIGTRGGNGRRHRKEGKVGCTR